jgi:hypothetical protein
VIYFIDCNSIFLVQAGNCIQWYRRFNLCHVPEESIAGQSPMSFM